MSGSPPDPDEIADNIVLDTPVLDRLQEANLPLRGERRQRLLQRVRFQIKQRRTTSRVAQRLSNVTIGTLTEAIDTEARDAVEERVEETLDRRFQE